VAGRIRQLLVAGAVIIGTLGLGAPGAHAAGIVTHAWMALDAIDNVRTPALQRLLDAHRDQVRAGAEFPDGGYWTRSLGTPGGDYGEEAHWQRFIDAYTAQIRDDRSCGSLKDPDGPCAATIAHLMGAAAHGMGDEVWDWLFEPNGPGSHESYLPPDFNGIAGPGGLELQMDIVAIARHARPTSATVGIPDVAKIGGAFTAIGRTDISLDAIPVGEQGLEIERGAETFFTPLHIDALERAMPWTSAHMTSAAGGVAFGARAVAGYYETIWDRLLGRTPATSVSAVAPAPDQVNVPATGWTGNYAPGSNPGNQGGLTRIAAALSSALPHNALANQGPVPSELPVDAFRLRDLKTGALVPGAAGFPRVVPYNPEAGEHVIGFQPAADLHPCRWYQAETTRALLDARAQPVTRATWRFRTSGCTAKRDGAVHGTVVCDATGGVSFTSGGAVAQALAHGGALARLQNCKGGEDGVPAAGASLPVARGGIALTFEFGGASCKELTTPTKPATVQGEVRWNDAAGREIGISRVTPQPYDPRGGTVTISARSGAFPAHTLALRLAPDATGCGGGAPLPIASGTVTAWKD
jgi:hypothetical protein